jgi:hypothetical protein
MVLQEILIHVHHSQKEIHTTRVVQESRNANEDHTTTKTPRLEELHIPNTFCISSSKVINFFSTDALLMCNVLNMLLYYKIVSGIIERNVSNSFWTN